MILYKIQFILFFIVIIQLVETKNNEKHQISQKSHQVPFRVIANNLTFFWINLERNVERKLYMENYFSKHSITAHQRVGAVEPKSFDFKQIKTLEKPCKRNGEKDVSVVMSHLKAIYTAIYFDLFNQNSEYAIILEDDIKLLYSIDFNTLIASAPKDFTILQISTSNPEALEKLYYVYSASLSITSVDQLWHKTAWTDKTKNGKTYLYWSAQGYIINKRNILRNFISYVIRTAGKPILEAKTPIDKIEYHIINSFYDTCKLEMKRPCIRSNCLFADSYIYAGGKPTYISTIPLITGAKIGLNSTIHQEEVDFHREGFQKIRQITQNVKQILQLFPSFIINDLNSN